MWIFCALIYVCKKGKQIRNYSWFLLQPTCLCKFMINNHKYISLLCTFLYRHKLVHSKHDFARNRNKCRILESLHTLLELHHSHPSLERIHRYLKIEERGGVDRLVLVTLQLIAKLLLKITYFPITAEILGHP